MNNIFPGENIRTETQNYCQERPKNPFFLLLVTRSSTNRLMMNGNLDLPYFSIRFCVKSGVNKRPTPLKNTKLMNTRNQSHALYSITITSCCYRPQTKFVKVMFLHVSVILSMGGRGWYPSMHHRSHDQTLYKQLHW